MNAIQRFIGDHREFMLRAKELSQAKEPSQVKPGDKSIEHNQSQFVNKNPAHRAATDNLTIAARIVAAVGQLLSPSMRRTVSEMFTNAPWKFIVPACTFCVAWMASQFLRGRAIGNVIDVLFKSQTQFTMGASSVFTPPSVLEMLSLPILFAFLEWGFNVLWDFFMSKAKAALIVNGRTRYFRSLLGQPLEFHSANSSAELAARLICDSEAIDEAIVCAPCHLLRGIFTLIVAAYIISIDPWLFLLGLALRLPWLLQFVEYAITVVSNYDLLETSASNIAQAHANEVFASIVTVQACTAEDEETDHFKSHLKKVSRIAETGSVVACGLRNVENGLTLSSEIIILAYGVSRVYNGQITFGVFMALKAHMEMFISQFNFFEKAYVAIKRASVQSARMFHLYDLYASSASSSLQTPAIVTAIAHNSKVKPGVVPSPILEFSHVYFSYPNLSPQPDGARMPVVLSDVSFSVPRRSSTAILGASGSGKSSIGRLLLRFYRPSSGTIHLHSAACGVSDSTRTTRDIVSWVDQGCCLMNRSIRDNLIMGLKAKPGELQIDQACKIAQIHDYILSLPDKYNTLCGQRGSSLSGGQQQRLVIARALLRQPELLLLDEATSALDAETEEAVVSALDRWKDQTGATLLIITHRIRTVRNCDAAIVLHQGKVKEFGTRDELIAKRGEFYNQMKSVMPG